MSLETCKQWIRESFLAEARLLQHWILRVCRAAVEGLVGQDNKEMGTKELGLWWPQPTPQPHMYTKGPKVMTQPPVSRSQLGLTASEPSFYTSCHQSLSPGKELPEQQLVGKR